MKHANVWKVLGLLVVAAFLTGCAGNDFRSEVLVLPRLQQYTGEFQEQAVVEVKKLPRACAHDAVSLECSATARMLQDYDNLRQRIKNARKEGWGW